MFYRLTFLILLTLNLALFAWGYQQSVPEQSSIRLPPPLNGPSIVLVSEATPLPIVTEKKVVITRTCLNLGPLERQKEALELIMILERSGHTAELVTETVKQGGGYWLVMAAKNGQTTALMAELNGAGVMDVWIFDDGPLAGLVSLGLYSKQTEAEKRRLALKRKGFYAEIKQRDIEVTNYWIHTSYITSEQIAEQAIKQAHELYPHLSVTPEKCES